MKGIVARPCEGAASIWLLFCNLTIWKSDEGGFPFHALARLPGIGEMGGFKVGQHESLPNESSRGCDFNAVFSSMNLLY